VSQALIALGQIVNTHALRGELRVRLYNPSSTTLAAGMRVALRRGSVRHDYVISGLRPHRHLALLTLEGCDSITAAEALVGYEVCICEDDLPAAAPGEIYHFQLIGMEVVTITGEQIGTVEEMMTTGSADICVVRGEDREYLIPLIDDVVKTVDREGGRIVIDPLPGLLDS
jgi:16S rRNA processing protein RimM